MYNFDVVKPSHIADAVKELSGSSESQPLGGGQTLIPTLKQRLASPEKLVSLGAIDEMKGVCQNDVGDVCIGGATTHATVAAAAGAYSALAVTASHIGDPAVRNRGTIGGKLAGGGLHLRINVRAMLGVAFRRNGFPRHPGPLFISGGPSCFKIWLGRKVRALSCFRSLFTYNARCLLLDVLPELLVES